MTEFFDAHIQEGASDISNTQDIYTELGDEALDAPVQHALVCGGPVCYVSDEALDPAPAQEAAACAICVYPCYVSDEELAAR